MKHQDIITDPELSKKLKAAGICGSPALGFWYELQRTYMTKEQQQIAESKGKTNRIEFNLSDSKIHLYENTCFTDEIGTYKMTFEGKFPAYTLDELMDYLPAKVLIDDEYIRHIEIEGDRITIYYESSSTSFRLGETVEDTDLMKAVARMIVTLNLQGCMN